MAANSPNILIIRFSSFGDIIQALTAAQAMKSRWPNARITWLTRSDYAQLINRQPHIDEVIAFSRADGLFGLLHLAWRLGRSGFTHVYDAHNNVRSNVVSLVLLASCFCHGSFPKYVQRPKHRLRRWLYFSLRLPLFNMPFSAAKSFITPLLAWGLDGEVAQAQSYKPQPAPEDLKAQIERLPRPRIAVVASAAWPMKRWPTQNWRQLMELMPDAGFAFFGGPEDTFLNELLAAEANRSLNFAGRTTLNDSISLLSLVDLVIANDTGLMHVADQMRRPTIALIGPTAFGYPSQSSSLTAEISLPCKPCSKDGRGPCRNDLYQRCLVELRPEFVVQLARQLLRASQ